MKSLFLAASLLGLASGASAATTFYTDWTAFLGATGGAVTLDVEDFEIKQAGGPTMTFPWGSVSESGGTPNVYNVDNDDIAGFTPIHDGVNAIGFFDDGAGSVGTFSFDTAIDTFGVYISTTYGTTANFAGGTWSTSVATGTTPSFFGVVSDTPFASFTVDLASGGDRIGFDLLKFGTVAPVPLPATGLLLLAGLGAVGLGARKKRA